MTLKFKLLNDKAVMPHKAHPTDAGYDLTATSKTYDNDGNIVYGTAIAAEIPEGCAGLLFPRSSIAKKDLALCNSVGVIDCHYRGEITAKFKPTLNFSKTPESAVEMYPVRTYDVGDRIAQLVIVHLPTLEAIQADELTDTDRGEGGFGSTGK